MPSRENVSSSSSGDTSRSSPSTMAWQGLQYSLISPSVDQVKLYFSALVENWGRAPTRIDTERNSSNELASAAAATDTKPGARPHWGMSTAGASMAMAATARADARSSVRSK